MTRIVIEPHDAAALIRESSRSVLAAHDLMMCRRARVHAHAVFGEFVVQRLDECEAENVLRELGNNAAQSLLMSTDERMSNDPALAAFDTPEDWRPHLVRLAMDVGDRDWTEVMRGLHRMLIRALDEHTKRTS